jgi:hypothetical protein
MNRATAVVLAAVCFLSAGSAARADAISYNFSPNTPQIFFNGTFSAARLMYSSGAAPSTSGAISTYLVAASFAPASMPQSISMPIDLTLSNGASSATVQVGTLSGLLWHNGSALSYTPATTSMDFDGHGYTFSSPSFIQASGLGFTVGKLTLTATDPLLPPPNPPGGGGNSPVGGPMSGAPEPSSLLLAGIGVPLLGIFLRRRRAKR